jgi:hypothetical protein
MGDLNKYGVSEEEFMKMLIDLLEVLIKEDDISPNLIESYVILLTFFANLNTNLDKMLLNYLTEIGKNSELEEAFQRLSQS